MKLIIEDDEGRKTVVPFAREEISIGRQEGNTIRLTERNVSRRHAKLVRKNGVVQVEDLGSFNGIRVNGDRIEGSYDLQEGDLLEIGDYDLAIEAEDADGRAVESDDSPSRRPTNPAVGFARAPTQPDLASEQGQPALEPADSDDEPPLPRHQATAVIRTQSLTGPARPVRDLPAGEQPKLVLLNTDEAGREIPVPKTEIRLGRTEGDNDVAVNHRSISRNHAKLIREDGGSWRLLDLQSANGVRVNGDEYGDTPISGGDVLELGHVRMRFVAPGERYVFHPDDSEQEGRKPAVLGNRMGLWIGLGALGLVGATALVFLVSSGKPAPEPKSHPASHSAPLAMAEPTAARAPAPMPPPPPRAAPEPAAPPAPARPSRKELLEHVAKAKGALKAHRIGDAKDELSQAEALSSSDPTVARLRKDVQAAEERASRPEKRHDRHPAAAAAEASPGPSKAERRAQAMESYNDAIQLINAENFEGALSKLQKTLELSPGLADAHKAMGICYAKLRQPDKGAVHYEQYLKLKPNASDAPEVRQMLDAYYRSRGQ